MKPPSDRTLEKDVPELKEYLQPGAKVLEVSCGRGTIARDVAEAIYPGKLVGMDPGEEFISLARRWAAEISHAVNITFQVGDTYKLDFPDETFDVV